MAHRGMVFKPQSWKMVGKRPQTAPNSTSASNVEEFTNTKEFRDKLRKAVGGEKTRGRRNSDMEKYRQNPHTNYRSPLEYQLEKAVHTLAARRKDSEERKALGLAQRRPQTSHSTYHSALSRRASKRALTHSALSRRRQHRRTQSHFAKSTGSRHKRSPSLPGSPGSPNSKRKSKIRTQSISQSPKTGAVSLRGSISHANLHAQHDHANDDHTSNTNDQQPSSKTIRKERVWGEDVFYGELPPPAEAKYVQHPDKFYGIGRVIEPTQPFPKFEHYATGGFLEGKPGEKNNTSSDGTVASMGGWTQLKGYAAVSRAGSHAANSLSRPQTAVNAKAKSQAEWETNVLLDKENRWNIKQKQTAVQRVQERFKQEDETNDLVHEILSEVQPQFTFEKVVETLIPQRFITNKIPDRMPEPLLKEKLISEHRQITHKIHTLVDAFGGDIDVERRLRVTAQQMETQTTKQLQEEELDNQRLRIRNKELETELKAQIKATATLKHQLDTLRSIHVMCGPLERELEHAKKSVEESAIKLGKQVLLCQEQEETIQKLLNQMTIHKETAANIQFELEGKAQMLHDELAIASDKQFTASERIKNLTETTSMISVERDDLYLLTVSLRDKIKSYRVLEERYAQLQAAHRHCELLPESALRNKLQDMDMRLTEWHIADDRRKDIVRQCKQLKTQMKPELGFTFTNSITQDGLEVTKVMPGSPAEQCGIEKGDLIEMVGGVRTSSKEHFADVATTFIPGKQIPIRVSRFNIPSQVIFTVGSPGFTLEQCRTVFRLTHVIEEDFLFDTTPFLHLINKAEQEEEARRIELEEKVKQAQEIAEQEARRAELDFVDDDPPSSSSSSSSSSFSVAM